MNVAIACDHGGFDLKEAIIEEIRASKNNPIDLGIFSIKNVDYPDYAEKIGNAIREGTAERGILICGSGVGACIAANKLKGIYASVCHDTYSAHQGVEHDNMNVLCMGGRILGAELAKEITRAFLQAEFSPEERHLRRTRKIRQLEEIGFISRED
ncbi:MAG: ribose 5-phosphate isomerase B [Anaerolineaceae bacterium]|nr:ribose 5-phosphate isomerase B [Anaerolineaceae bacterium]